jgi:NAD+ synthase (glutamine-hydrolysing)
MKITIAQLNPTVGDFEGNFEKIKEGLKKAKKQGGDIVIFPELFVTGYPPRDLLEKKEFVKKALLMTERIKKISVQFQGIGILLGNVTLAKDKTENPIFNSAILIHNGKIIFTQNKSLLPRNDVFDEPRYFKPAESISVFPFKGEILGITICEDIWTDLDWLGGSYFVNPLKSLALSGATVFLNISGSPFYAGKEKVRYRLLRDQALKYKIPIVYVNQVGGNDELIFDGTSMVVDAKGELKKALPSFSESIETVDISGSKNHEKYVFPEEIASIRDALVLGIKDYFRKCGFKKAVIGISGGIDSAVTASLVAKAIGGENILGIGMPSKYSSKGSVGDAQKLVKNLGIDFKIIPIKSIHESYLDSLKKDIKKAKGGGASVAEQNIQARIRGNILMAFSNEFPQTLVVSTGDKSELAVGYCTLYGDMTGGLSVISDVPKTKVYELARFINRGGEIIPEAIIKKAPSAELTANQLTEKELIPYKILDPIIEFYIEERMGPDGIVKKGFNRKIVEWVTRKIDKNEFKRRQAAPGLKVTTKAFGMGRRMPIAANYN